MANGSYKLLKDIHIGDSVASWNGYAIVPDTVKNIWQTETKTTIIVQSTGYLPVTTSYDHVFATTGCSNPETSPVLWKKAGEIIKTRALLNYAGMPLGKIHNPDLAEFIGYMTCDGYVSGYQQPKFTNTHKEILNRVAELAKKLFGYNAIWRIKGNAYDLGFSNGTLGGGCTKNKIKELFRTENLDVPKSKKYLHPMVWNFDESSLGRFFAAVISSDGNLYLQKDRPPLRKRIMPTGSEITISCGSSDQLGWDIYWLLRKMGIIPHVPYKEKNSNWKIKIGKCFAIKKILSYGTIYGKKDQQQALLERAATQHNSILIWNGCYRSLFRSSPGISTELYDIETHNNHNFIANGYVVHNSGKDIVAFNYMLRDAIHHIGVYYYIFPTYSQARKVIWDSITNDGRRFIDFIPPELVANSNSTEMKITLTNGSLMQLLGSDDVDRLVGTNPRGIVFSEYALQDPRAYQFLRPALTANDGWCLFCSTPRGKNSFWELYQIAINNPNDWFAQHLTVDQTQHISLLAIQREKESGEMSDDLIQQEYYCSFDQGVEGSYYGKYLDRMRIKGQIGIVPHELGFKVNSSWDIGVRDSTSIIMWQNVGQIVRIIDYYENSKQGLEHYVKVLEQKPYTWGKHIAPHDIAVKEFGSGMTRIEKARQLGIKFITAPNLSIEDGIESVRSTFSKIWIDEQNCKPLIKAIENYRQEWDSKKQIYKSQPLHNIFSHAADALRYLCISLPKTRDGSTSPEELDARYREAVLGHKSNLPNIFQDDIPGY